MSKILWNELNKKNPTWKANYNSIFVKNESYKKIISSGLKLSFEDGETNIISEISSEIYESETSDLPAFFDLRNISGKNYICYI
jgi:hypothetical protein